MAAGPATELVEATATSVGAGMLLGGFVASLLVLVAGAEPVRRDEMMFVGSSAAGLLTIVLAAIEMVV